MLVHLFFKSLQNCWLTIRFWCGWSFAVGNTVALNKKTVILPCLLMAGKKMTFPNHGRLVISPNLFKTEHFIAKSDLTKITSRHLWISLQNLLDSSLIQCSLWRCLGERESQEPCASGTESVWQSPQRNSERTTVWAWVQTSLHGPSWCCCLDFLWGTASFPRRCNSSLQALYGGTPVTSRERVDDKDRKTNLSKA